MKNILLPVALLFWQQLAVLVPVFIGIIEIFNHGQLYCDLSSAVTHWAFSFVTLDMFSWSFFTRPGTWRPGGTMGGREPVPPPPVTLMSVFLYKKGSGRVACLQVCWRGEKRAHLYGIFLLKASQGATHVHWLNFATFGVWWTWLTLFKLEIWDMQRLKWFACVCAVHTSY